MANTISYKKLNETYFFVLSCYQSFGMCLYDIDTIRSGNSVGYGMDGYDLCRYFFPTNFFVSKPNPHHTAIHNTWDHFFRQSDGVNTFGFISPFAILEALATIEERASGRTVNEIISTYNYELHSLLKELANDAQKIEDVASDQKKVVILLHQLIKVAEKTRNTIQKGGLFNGLENLIDEGKIKLLDPFVGKMSGTSELIDLLSYDQNGISRALNYLNYRRERAYSRYSLFYDTLDVYHYVLFEKVEPLLKRQNVTAYLSSSGILSRNSWLITKYGKLPNDLNGIPSDWSARSSDVPNYVTKVIAHFKNNLSDVRDFFEEAHGLTRVILRDLQEIPEVMGGLSNSDRRHELMKQNPSISIKNKIPQAVLRLQNDYYRIVTSEIKEGLVTGAESANDEIDFNALYSWITNPESRAKEFTNIATQIKNEANSLSLIPKDWRLYIAPLGDVAYDVLKTFDPLVDV